MLAGGDDRERFLAAKKGVFWMNECHKGWIDKTNVWIKEGVVPFPLRAWGANNRKLS